METPKGIKLLDFGLAKYATTTLFGDAETTLTAQGAVLGTPATWPPNNSKATTAMLAPIFSRWG